MICVCTPEFLLQFGFMGSFYAQKALNKANPRVALLNNGAEEGKGDQLHKDAYQLLKKASEHGQLNFIGNIEARDVPDGVADVIVADGFSGNVLLKSIEGTALYMAGLIKGVFKRNLLSKLGYLFCKKGAPVDLVSFLHTGLFVQSVHSGAAHLRSTC